MPLQFIERAPPSMSPLLHMMCTDGRCPDQEFYNSVILKIVNKDVGKLRRCLDKGLEEEGEAYCKMILNLKFPYLTPSEPMLPHQLMERMECSVSLPLLVSGKMGHDDCTAALLEHGADPNLTDESGLFPLAALASCRTWAHRKCILLLLEHGANINQRMQDGSTAMHIATQNNHTGFVILLLDREERADVNSRGKDGKTCLHLAAQNNFHEAITLLLHFGATVNAITDSSSKDPAEEHGATPLFIAARKNRIQSVKVLAKAGADALMPNKAGATPLSVAKRLGFRVCAQLLEDSVKAKKEPQESEVQSSPQQGVQDLEGLTLKQLKGMLHKMNLQCPPGLEKGELVQFVHASREGKLKEQTLASLYPGADFSIVVSRSKRAPLLMKLQRLALPLELLSLPHLLHPQQLNRLDHVLLLKRACGVAPKGSV